MSSDDGHHSHQVKHIPFLFFLQLVLVVLFGFFVEYDSPSASPVVHHAPDQGVGNSTEAGNDHHGAGDVNTLGHYYPSKLLIVTKEGWDKF